MTKRQIILAILLSLIGLVVWIAVGKFSNEVEPWDSMGYFLMGLPIMFISAGIAGYLEPKFPWWWGFFVVILQPIALLSQGAIGPLAIVGLIYFIFFFGLATFCAFIGINLRGYRTNKPG